jgi:TonB family protein
MPTHECGTQCTIEQWESTEIDRRAKGYHVEKMQRRWRSYVVSGLAHVCAAMLLLALTVPVVEHTGRPLRRLALIAPVLHQPVLTAPPQPRHETKPPVARIDAIPAVIPKSAQESPPLAMKPLSQPAARVESPPKVINLEIPQHAPPVLSAALPIAPKVEVRTGTFDQTAAPAATMARTTVAVGAFGDSSARAGANEHGSAGRIQVGGFGDRTVSSAENRPARQPEPDVYTPVEILFKPRPAYTADARDARVEGEVSLEVVFLANGEIRVGRVLRGLGHGLDEAAQQAAALVRFKPAMRGGVPVDTAATIRITFALT